MRAKVHRDRMLSNQNDDPFVDNQWQWMGPWNRGGRTRALVIDPRNPQVMYAGAVSGGVWKTTNGGQLWRPLDDFAVSLIVNCLAIDPRDPNTIYAGTGESFATDGHRGAGILKTTDAGATWVQLASTNPGKQRNSIAWNYVNRIAIGTNGDLLAGIGLDLKTNGGIYRSTNGGSTWTLEAGTGLSAVLDVKFDPNDATQAIAGGNGLVWYYDSTASRWQPAAGIPSGSKRIELGYGHGARRPRPTIYASVDLNASASPLLKSTDGGRSFTTVNPGSIQMNQTTVAYLGDQASYDNVVWVDPTDDDTLIVGGVDLWRSRDGGRQLVQISDWRRYPGGSIHADHHVIVEHPSFGQNGNKTVYFGNDGGVFRTDDVYAAQQTSGWVDLNRGYGTIQFYGAAVNHTSGVLIGGTQDNGTLRTEGVIDAWQPTVAGDGGQCAADQNDPNIFYGEYIHARVFRSTDAGRSASWACGLYSILGQERWMSPPFVITDAQGTSNAPFIAPIALDPHDSNTLVVGADSIWRSRDIKSPINYPASGPRWSVIQGPVAGAKASALAFSASDDKSLAVGYDDGTVLISRDMDQANPSFLPIAALPTMVTSLAFDPTDADVLFATVGGFQSDRVRKISFDTRTRQWGTASVSGSGNSALPPCPVFSILVHPRNPRRLFVGGEIGAFSSEDGGATWKTTRTGPANVPVDQLVWREPNFVIAATYGRGAYMIAVPALPVATEWASVDPNGNWVLSPEVRMPPGSRTLSADGRFVVFSSTSAQLVANDRNDKRDVFVRDLELGSTELISVSTTGQQGNGNSNWASISYDGRFVAFQSVATNLVANDTNSETDVFVRDRQSRLTLRVNVPDGQTSGNANGASYSPMISGDGTRVSFATEATNLAPGQSPTVSRSMIVRDWTTNKSLLVTLDSSGRQDASRTLLNPTISGDGNSVAFSTGEALFQSDTNNQHDIYVWRISGMAPRSLQRASISTSGSGANLYSDMPMLNHDGSRIVFRSDATNLVAQDLNGHRDAFYHDFNTRRTGLISQSSLGAQADSFTTGNVSISGCGSFVAFHTAATNLVPDQSSRHSSLYLHDLDQRKTTRLKTDSGAEFNQFGSSSPSLSRFGTHLALATGAHNLVSRRDANLDVDIYVLPGPQAAEASLVTAGRAEWNSSFGFSLNAPREGGQTYLLLLSSGTYPGIDLFGRRIPLVNDALFAVSAGLGLVGTLDTNGRASLAIPIPVSIPTTLYAAYATLRPGSAEALRVVSNSVAITIQRL
ncbi:MAG: hypothetical protein H6833_08115 [Planctomycetes bacterium]|nr:hypothetical protein [Planctomycetota bacterium]